ncbi:hypothetical protein OUZ56_024684 [Daphnia magna]|uniref:DUF6570 domain-containing protein n=1 Tax=Daphnia magna TaxID=35525 RepID=A0ABR0B194_9CRUS|nr:hypothetical protein OUZ56_024684 [Daphnia magna]
MVLIRQAQRMRVHTTESMEQSQGQFTVFSGLTGDSEGQGYFPLSSNTAENSASNSQGLQENNFVDIEVEVGEGFIELGEMITEANQNLPLEIEVLSTSIQDPIFNLHPVLSSNTQAPILNLHCKETPSAQKLVNFEKDPIVALLALAVNSGQNRFSASAKLYGSTPEEERNLLEELKREVEGNFDIRDSGRIVDEFQQCFDKDSLLLGCACCGIRAFQMNKVLYLPVPVAELDLLKLNEERQLLFYAIPNPYQLCVSVYLSSSGKLYHLHPELVKDGIASLCSTCHRNIKSSKPKIPNLCIAAGIDFGHPGRLGLPQLTLSEELLICRSRQYVAILKLDGYNASERQKAKKGHVITYPQPDGTTKSAELQRLNSNFDGGEYPRTENFGEFLSICFISSRLQFDSLIPTRFGDVNELRVRVDVVYLWLHALKHLNPLYRNASIIETEAMHMKLQNILVELIENASIVDAETEIQIDRLVTPEGLSDVPTDEIQDSDKNPDMPLPVSLLTRSLPVTTDCCGPAISA